jgi:hypothetical protein
VLDCSFMEELDTSMQSDLVESLGNLHKIRHLRLGGAGILEKDTWDAAVLPRPLQRLDRTDFTVLPSCINPTNLPNLAHLDTLVSELCYLGVFQSNNNR